MAGVTGTRAVIAAVGVALVLGVAACSGSDPEPKLAPPSSTAPGSPSTSPASAEHDQEAFVRGFFEAIGHATKSGDTSEFIAMTSGTCGNCQVLAQNIEGAYAGGSRVEGADWRIIRTLNAGERPEGDVWNVDVKTAKERWYDSSGDLIKIVDASTQHFGVIVAVRGDSFRIADMRLRS